MKAKSLEYIDTLFMRAPALKVLGSQLHEAIDLLITCYKSGGRVFTCGNGGSAADAEHIVGELVKSFMKKRPIKGSTKSALEASISDKAKCEYLCANLEEGLPAISLVSGVALPTAFANDVASDMVFAQQFYVLANENDVLIGISTSGNSKNVNNALYIAHVMGCKTIGLTGKTGGEMADLLDVELRAPHDSTPIIQEYHLPLYHTICAVLEEELFS